MTRICIIGGPRTGKTTLADAMASEAEQRHARAGTSHGPARHTDDLIDGYRHLGTGSWSAVSQHIADHWLIAPGPWIIEGVAAVRALRKWRDQHPGEPPPVDRVIALWDPHVDLTPGQRSMAKGVETVWREIKRWLQEHRVRVEERPMPGFPD